MAPAGIVSLKYGGVEMSQDIKDSVWKQIKDCGHFYVRNDTMGGDPQPGVVKTAIVDFIAEDDSAVQRQYCAENGRYDFAWQTLSIKYGDKVIDNPEVYWRFTKASFEEGKIMVNNDNLGGDPQPGVLKRCTVYTRYREAAAFDTGKERTGNSMSYYQHADEGHEISLEALKGTGNIFAAAAVGVGDAFEDGANAIADAASSVGKAIASIF